MILFRRNGFTLVELLVVIGIVGVLVGLLMVAVQAARESARLTACKSNLNQIGLAAAAHHAAHRHFATGGWGWGWQGDPDRGFGARQPGGWTYGLLPFLEERELRGRGARQSEPQKRQAVLTVAATPLAIFHCPSRRSAVAYPFVDPRSIFFNIDRPDALARTDYAANTGDVAPELYGSGPESLAEGDGGGYRWPAGRSTGICFRRSTIRAAHIRDGLSTTYFAAEKHLKPEHYDSGAALNDDQGLFVGYDRDTLRVTALDSPPRHDGEPGGSDQVFGGAHTAVFQAVFCDGTVRVIGYDIDPEIHRRLGNRADGVAVAPF